MNFYHDLLKNCQPSVNCGGFLCAPNLDEIEALPQRHHHLWGLRKDGPNKLDEDAFEEHLADEERSDLMRRSPWRGIFESDAGWSGFISRYDAAAAPTE